MDDHGDDDDHVHFDGGGGGATQNDVWNDAAVTLTTVGVDIGSSTTHFSVSRLRLTLQGARYVPAGATLLYESPILLTPYAEGEMIDIDALSRFFESHYETANIRREDIDTGVVLLTGLAADRSNARRTAEIFADGAGRFVAMSAGHHLEAELSVRGSGALASSRETGSNVLHVDIGGGTTKYAYCRNGKILATAALAVGARLVVRDEDGVIIRLEEAGKTALRNLNISAGIGDRISDETTTQLCDYLADRVLDVITGGELSSETSELFLTHELHVGPVDAITFSGGVSEYIYGRVDTPFGDLGRMLGAAVKARVDQTGIAVVEPEAAGIRATVMGASRFAVHVSSQTVFIDPRDAVPIRNVAAVVVDPFATDESATHEEIAEAITLAVKLRDLDIEQDQLALALRWSGMATYGRLDAVCRGMIEAMQTSLDHGRPLIVVANQDVGRLLGLHIRQNGLFKGPLVFVDSIELRDFDYIDIASAPEWPGATPVIVKSLVFPA